MTKQRLQKLIHKTERGQAIILIAFAIIGLVAMVGLVTDTGILLIEYGKLKRGVDAAAVAAAQQYRLQGNALDQAALENAAKNFLQLNQSTDLVEDSVIVHSCASPVADRPALCNPDPVNHPNDNRKLVEVIATKNVYFGFLRVIGIESTTVTANAVGEAATIDLVLVIDTSGSMAYETDGVAGQGAGDDPSACNLSDTCQPMKVVKDTALAFLDTLYVSNDPNNSYDRVAVIVMTSQNPGGDRNPREVLALTSNKAAIVSAINGIKVFEPSPCDPDNIPDSIPLGTCLKYHDTTGIFERVACQTYDWSMNPNNDDNIPDPQAMAHADPSSCPSSNVGGALKLARESLVNDPAPRLDAFWVVVSLLGGPANATDSAVGFPNGYCPRYTWTYPWITPSTIFLPELGRNGDGGDWCRDRYPSVRHDDNDVAPYTNPVNGDVSDEDLSIYDADDFARDKADDLAKAISGDGVTVFTIGLGAPIKSTSTVAAGEKPAAEALLQYIAECAGEDSPDDCATSVTSPVINHGQYFYAPNNLALADIFDRIAKNIATKISQ